MKNKYKQSDYWHYQKYDAHLSQLDSNLCRSVQERTYTLTVSFAYTHTLCDRIKN